MTLNDIIMHVLAGGLLGALGQGIRIAVGLKKLNDSNTVKATEGQPADPFSTSRLILSIFIGFIAGAIGMLIKGGTDKNDYDTQFIVTIMAIGYSGADFIEGVFNTYINRFNSANSLSQTPGNASLQPSKEQPLQVRDESLANTHLAQG